MFLLKQKQEESLKICEGKLNFWMKVVTKWEHNRWYLFQSLVNTYNLVLECAVFHVRNRTCPCVCDIFYFSHWIKFLLRVKCYRNLRPWSKIIFFPAFVLIFSYPSGWQVGCYLHIKPLSLGQLILLWAFFLLSFKSECSLINCWSSYRVHAFLPHLNFVESYRGFLTWSVYLHAFSPTGSIYSQT